MDENTRKILSAPFKKEQVKQRQGSFGKMLNYVEGSAVIERMNHALNHAWGFEILSTDINTDAGEVIAHVRISADGVIKEGYGSSQIKRQRESGQIIDLGNDIKAACTDALKKAATLYGVGLHLYQDAGSAEAEEAKHQPEPAPPQRSQSHTGSRAGSIAGATHSYPSPGYGQSSPSSGSTSRLSQKQHSYLLKLASAHGLDKRELNSYCQQTYGVMLDFLPRQDASALIDQLRQGGIPAYNGDAA